LTGVLVFLVDRTGVSNFCSDTLFPTNSYNDFSSAAFSGSVTVVANRKIFGFGPDSGPGSDDLPTFPDPSDRGLFGAK
jgi:hypothetical protein